MKPFQSVALVGLFMANAATAQSTLQAYIEEGLKNNQELLQHTLTVDANEYALAEAKGLYMPTVNLESNYTLADGGRTINFPIGDLLNPVYTSLNQITDQQQFQTIENVNEQFFLNDFHDTKFRFIQPLFNSDIYYSQKAQQGVLTASMAKKEAYQTELIKEISVAYFNYWQLEQAINIYDANGRTLQALVDFNQTRLREGQITADELYRAEFELAQLKADKAGVYAQKATAQAYFNFLLNRDYRSEILLDSTLNVLPLTQREVADPVADAIGNRHEISEVRAAKEAQVQVIKMARGSKLPQINSVVDWGYQGEGYRFDGDQNYWLVNIGFSWNLFKGFQNKNKVQRAHIQLQTLESQEKQLASRIALEVTQSRQEFNASKRRFQAKEYAHRSAKKNFNIVHSQYQESQALLVEFLDAQSTLLEAQLDLNIAKYDLFINNAQWERAMAY